MNRVVASIVLLFALAFPALAQYSPYIQSGNIPVPPQVLLCAGSGRTAVECGTSANPLFVQGGTGGGGGGGASTVAGSMEQDVRASASLNVATANATLSLAVNGQATVGFTFTGLTASGATLTYEQSIDGGTTWTGINAINRGTGVPEPTRSTDGQLALSATGRSNIRVRVTTAGTGSITVATNISVREGIFHLGSPLPPGVNNIGAVSVSNFPATQAISAASLPLPAGAAAASKQAAPSVAGTSSVDVITVQGTVNGVPQNVTQPDTVAVPGSPFTNAAAGVIFSVDTTGFQTVTTQITGTFAATVQYEGSNDNTNWVAIPGTNVTSAGTIISNAQDNTTGVARTFPVLTRYFRARTSAYASGSIVLSAILRQSSPGYNAVYLGGGVVTLQTGSNQVGGVFNNAANQSGGLATNSRFSASAASTNATVAKASAGRVYKITGINTSAAVKFLKFYNTATAPTVGSTAIFYTLPLPVGAFSFDASDLGFYHSTGISYSLTGAVADADATALAAGDVSAFTVWYQ